MLISIKSALKRNKPTQHNCTRDSSDSGHIASGILSEQQTARCGCCCDPFPIRTASFPIRHVRAPAPRSNEDISTALTPRIEKSNVKRKHIATHIISALYKNYYVGMFTRPRRRHRQQQRAGLHGAGPHVQAGPGRRESPQQDQYASRSRF